VASCRLKCRLVRPTLKSATPYPYICSVPVCRTAALPACNLRAHRLLRLRDRRRPEGLEPTGLHSGDRSRYRPQRRRHNLVGARTENRRLPIDPEMRRLGRTVLREQRERRQAPLPTDTPRQRYAARSAGRVRSRRLPYAQMPVQGTPQVSGRATGPNARHRRHSLQGAKDRRSLPGKVRPYRTTSMPATRSRWCEKTRRTGSRCSRNTISPPLVECRRRAMAQGSPNTPRSRQTRKKRELEPAGGQRAEFCCVTLQGIIAECRGSVANEELLTPLPSALYSNRPVT